MKIRYFIKKTILWGLTASLVAAPMLLPMNNDLQAKHAQAIVDYFKKWTLPQATDLTKLISSTYVFNEQLAQPVNLFFKNVTLLHGKTIDLIKQIPSPELPFTTKDDIITALNTIIKKFLINDLKVEEAQKENYLVTLATKIFEQYGATLKDCCDKINTYSNNYLEVLKKYRKLHDSYLFFGYRIHWNESLFEKNLLGDNLHDIENIIKTQVKAQVESNIKDNTSTDLLRRCLDILDTGICKVLGLQIINKDDFIVIRLSILTIILWTSIFTGSITFFEIIEQLDPSSFINFCRKRDTEKLLDFIQRHTHNNIPDFSLTAKIHKNDDQVVRESAASDFDDIVRILLTHGASIQAKNYETVANALENNCIKTLDVIFAHLVHHGLLDEAENILESEAMLACIKEDQEQIQRYKKITERFRFYKYSFFPNWTIQNKSFLHSAVLWNEPDTIKDLFKQEQSLNIPDQHSKKTAFEYAKELGCQEAVDALLTHATVKISQEPERYALLQQLQTLGCGQLSKEDKEFYKKLKNVRNQAKTAHYIGSLLKVDTKNKEQLEKLTAYCKYQHNKLIDARKHHKEMVCFDDKMAHNIVSYIERDDIGNRYREPFMH